ncbi:MAG: PaaI family thioesterase [Desulfobacterales bacterium]
MVKIRTHEKIDRILCGEPIFTEDGASKVKMIATASMTVDDTGLVHGGFIFGLADHAAMIAVNHPNVVLAAAEVKFLKPVKSDDSLLAEARVPHEADKKRIVIVTVKKGDIEVFKGTFTCFVPEKHVLG